MTVVDLGVAVSRLYRSACAASTTPNGAVLKDEMALLGFECADAVAGESGGVHPTQSLAKW